MLKHSARGGYRGSIPWPGSWSLAAYPRSYRPVTPSEKLLAISPHSVGRSKRQYRHLGGFPAGDDETARRIVADQICATCRMGAEVVIKRTLQTFERDTSGAGPSIANSAVLSNAI